MSDNRRRRRSIIPWEVHPVWRGIGCIFMVLIPILAFSVADLIMKYLAGTELALDTPSRVLPFIGEIPNFWVWLMLSLLLIPLFLWVLSLLGAIIYSALGGPRNERLAELNYRETHTYDQDGRH